MTSLIQSSRDQFCNLYMGLQGGTYDGWGQKSFLSDLCAPAAQRSSPAGVSKRCHSRGAGRRLTSAPTTRELLPSPTTPPLIRALSAERPHQNEHHREPGEKPKMHPPFEFGLARPSPITVIDQERSQHTCERDEDQPGPAHSGLSLPKNSVHLTRGQHRIRT
jgi:hypothetical protein